MADDTDNPNVESENSTASISDLAASFEEPKTSGGSAVVSSASASKPATSPAQSHHSAPSSPAPGGVDSSKLDVDKARATMKLMGARPHPGTMKGLSGDNCTPGGGTVNTKSNLATVTPGQHPWIALGRQGPSTATTKKKIVLPPEGAWGDGHPGGVKKLF